MHGAPTVSSGWQMPCWHCRPTLQAISGVPVVHGWPCPTASASTHTTAGGPASASELAPLPHIRPGAQPPCTISLHDWPWAGSSGVGWQVWVETSHIKPGAHMGGEQGCGEHMAQDAAAWVYGVQTM